MKSNLYIGQQVRLARVGTIIEQRDTMCCDGGAMFNKREYKVRWHDGIVSGWLYDYELIEQEKGAVSKEEIENQIASYEQVFGMSSEEFLERVREGAAPDTFETMDWKILLRYCLDNSDES